jgi:hypothetical protein
MSDLKAVHTQIDVITRVNVLLRECHELAVTCGCDAVLLFVIDDEVHCWASPALEGLVTDHAPRQVIKSLLLEPLSNKDRQETLALYLSGKMSGDEHNFPGVQHEDEETRDVSFIEDVDAREKHFKKLLAHIHTESEAIGRLESPINERTYEYLLVVAVPTGKIFAFATPGLKPLVGTDEGKKLISTLLETNLKLMAEEGDPNAALREKEAVKRAQEKMKSDE